MTNADHSRTSPLGEALLDIPGSQPAASPVPGHESFLPETLLGIPLMLQVVIGTTRMTLASVAALRQGSVVVLDQPLGAPVVMMVNGREVAQGELFVTEGGEGRLAIRITSVLAGQAA